MEGRRHLESEPQRLGQVPSGTEGQRGGVPMTQQGEIKAGAEKAGQEDCLEERQRQVVAVVVLDTEVLTEEEELWERTEAGAILAP